MQAPRFKVSDLPKELLAHGRNAKIVNEAFSGQRGVCASASGKDADDKRPVVVPPVSVPQGEEHDTRVSIHVHHRRRRLADPGNLQAKAAIDELVRFGILQNDSARYVAQEIHTQEQVKTREEEETIITIRKAK